jgi:hypothetical protein
LLFRFTNSPSPIGVFALYGLSLFYVGVTNRTGF